MTSRSTVLGTLLAFSALASVSRPQDASRAFVLDSGAKQLVALDLASAKRVAEVPLDATPSGIQMSPDGRYLVVLDRGPGEDKKERGYRATGRSSVTVVDTASQRPVGRVVLGFGLMPGAFFPEGRMALLCPGYDAKDPKDSLPRELVTIDLATASEVGRLGLDPGTFQLGQSRDKRTLALIGMPRDSKPSAVKAQLLFVDLAGPALAASLETDLWGPLGGDGDRIYLLDPGKADKNPQKNRNATLAVVSLVERRVERLEAGFEPTAVGEFEDLLLLASGGRPGGGAGELRAFRAGAPAATLAVAATPRLVERVGDTIYVVGTQAVTLVDAATLQVSGTLELTREGQPIVDGGDRPFELAVTLDRRRAFIHYPVADKVAVLDLERRRAIGSAKTGRGGKKFFNTMMAGLTYGASERTYWYNRGDPPQIQLRRDGRFAYVLNLDTNDVTIVDSDTAAAVHKIGGGGYEVRLLGEQIVLVVGSEIHVIDAARNVKLDQIRLPGLRGLVSSEDGTVAVALAERTVLILDGATGKPRAQLTDFVRPERIVFARAAAAP